MDRKTRAIFRRREVIFETFTVPVVGDFVVFTDDVTHRICHVWPDSVQPAEGGKFYLSARGVMEFEGALGDRTSRQHLRLLPKRWKGVAWIHREGVFGSKEASGQVFCRVWQSSLASQLRREKVMPYKTEGVNYVTLWHDGFARVWHIRRCVTSGKGGCAWCGCTRKHGGLFQYGTLSESYGASPNWETKSFCSKGCRSSHA